MPMDQEKLKTRRLLLGLTQAEVAKLAGMSQPNYARIESGERVDPNVSTAERIATALQTTVDALLISPKKKKRR